MEGFVKKFEKDCQTSGYMKEAEVNISRRLGLPQFDCFIDIHYAAEGRPHYSINKLPDSAYRKRRSYSEHTNKHVT